MDEQPPITIVLLAGQPETARRWGEILADPQTVIWLGRPEPDQGRPDLIVTDLPQADPRDSGDPGVVRLGAAGAADVRLAADCPAGELRLACRLLAQIVRLRRRERLAADLHRKLSLQALTDPLTGLPNRRAWEAALAQRWTLAEADAGPLCLAIIDLDRFKPINDLHGHAVGDEVLRTAGQAIYDNVRQDDFVARLGGDEFGLLLWVADEPMAAAVVERVRASLGARCRQALLPPVTASAGYRLSGTKLDLVGSAHPAGGPESLYSAADASLRKAKDSGRNRTVGHQKDDAKAGH